MRNIPGHSPFSAAPYKYARDETRSPCICLVCGEIVCRSSSESQGPGFIGSTLALFNIDHTVGPCNAHTAQCCGSTGLFLRVKECSLLLLNIIHNGRNNRTRGTLLPAPYVDDYGETDQNLRFAFDSCLLANLTLFILGEAIHYISARNDIVHYIEDGSLIVFQKIFQEIWNSIKPPFTRTRGVIYEFANITQLVSPHTAFVF